MKIFKTCIYLLLLSLITTYCTPQEIESIKTNKTEDIHATGDDDATVDDGSKP